MMTKYIIFDGTCGFCNNTVMFFAVNDINKKFTFVSSLSKFGIELLSKNKLKGVEFETIILFQNKSVFFTKSTAIQRILLDIPHYNVIGYFMSLIPRFIKDFIYDAVSKRRKKIIKNESCKIPSMEIQKKFILE